MDLGWAAAGVASASTKALPTIQIRTIGVPRRCALSSRAENRERRYR